MSSRMRGVAGVLAAATVVACVGGRAAAQSGAAPSGTARTGKAQSDKAQAARTHAGTLPAASEILSRYTRAVGGERAIRKYRSRRALGRFELRAQGIAGPLEILAAAPNRIRIRITLAGLGEMLRGYDGAIGWSMDPAIGPRVLSGGELEETLYLPTSTPTSTIRQTTPRRRSLPGPRSRDTTASP